MVILYMPGKKTSKGSKRNNTNTKKNKKAAKTQKNKTKSTKGKKKSRRGVKTVVRQPMAISTLHDKLMDHLQQLRSRKQVREQPSIEPIVKPANRTERPILVLFHADWCGHCHRLMPQWNEMKGHLLSNNTYTPDEIKEIESADQEDKMREIKENFMNENEHVQMDGYPTMGKIADGKFEKYNGDRDTSSLIRWAGGEK